MATIEERVAFIEGQMSEQSHALIELRDAVRHVDQKLDARFQTLDDKVSRQFVWLVGVQVTTLLAVVGALLARS